MIITLTHQEIQEAYLYWLREDQKIKAPEHCTVSFIDTNYTGSDREFVEPGWLNALIDTE